MYDQYCFPYRPLRGHLSPMVPIRLFYNRAQMATHAYADSGAFYSVFLPFVAHHLGIEMTRGERKQITVGNGGIITVYLHRVGFRLGDEHFTATIGFSSELGIGFNLLGRFSIFDRLMFCFNDHASVLYVSRIGGTGDG